MTTPWTSLGKQALSVNCSRHGDQAGVAICPHLLNGTGKGWHMLGSGSDERPDAICFDCRDAWPEDLSAEEAGIGIEIVCAPCYDEIRERNDTRGPSSF